MVLYSICRARACRLSDRHILARLGGEDLGSIDEYSRNMDFVVKSGRAVAFPIYKGTFERVRPDGYPLPGPRRPIATTRFWP